MNFCDQCKHFQSGGLCWSAAARKFAYERGREAADVRLLVHTPPWAGSVRRETGPECQFFEAPATPARSFWRRLFLFP